MGLVLAFCPDSRLLCREVESLRPPFFAEVSRRLAGILGESWDSGRGLGLDGRSILAVLSPCQEGSRWAVQGRGARIENRADNRRFRVRFCFATRRAGRGKNRPPGGREKNA